MIKASEFVKKAISFEGYNELDKSFEIFIDTYNSYLPHPRGYIVKTTDNWCATFVSAVAIKSGCESILPIECGCQEMINKFKEIKCWQENENIVPELGWIIFYDWQDNGKGDNKGWSDHVGIVIEVNKEDKKIVVLEGNYKNKVTRRIISINGKYIRGYGVPKYEKENVKYFKKYKGTSGSIVVALTSINEDSSFDYRRKIAIKNKITNYKGTYEQNIKMLNLLKNGKLIKP